jgi:hypothetical protein
MSGPGDASRIRGAWPSLPRSEPADALLGCDVRPRSWGPNCVALAAWSGRAVLRGRRCLVRAGCIAWPSLPGPAGPPVRSSATVTPVIVCAVSAPSGGFLGIQAGNCWSDHARDRPRQASVAGWPRPLPQGHCIAFPGLLSRKFVRAGRPRGGSWDAETRDAETREAGSRDAGGGGAGRPRHAGTSGRREPRAASGEAGTREAGRSAAVAGWCAARMGSCAADPARRHYRLLHDRWTRGGTGS